MVDCGANRRRDQRPNAWYTDQSERRLILFYASRDILIKALDAGCQDIDLLNHFEQSVLRKRWKGYFSIPNNHGVKQTARGAS